MDHDGVIHRTRALNLPSGLHLTLHDGGALQAERSLPKALRGDNITDLLPGEEVEALAAVDREIADALGDDLPPLGSWLPNRVDYCQNVHLRDEAEVMRTLEKLAGVELPRKGLPVRGQEHSVTWSHGAIRPKVYSKFLETRGDPRACGVLRFESGVIRVRSFRDLVSGVGGRACSSDDGRLLPEGASPVLRDWASAVEFRRFRSERPAVEAVEVSVSSVLTPAFHAAVLGKFVTYLRGDLMSTNELSDLDFTRELLGFFGGRKCAVLVGWCGIFYLMGVRSRKDMLASSFAAPATRYRIAADLRRFRVHLVEKGLGGDFASESTDVAVDHLLVRIGALGKAA